MISNKDECHVANDLSTKKSDRIISEYLFGNWQEFFKIWNLSFPLHFKDSTEYKIMTLNLRVHYAILPIRVFQLHQNINCTSNCSNTVSEILKNVADQYTNVNNEMELNKKQNNLIIHSMKQLEYFLNSIDGKKLMVQLKNSSVTSLFALPYILNPVEDKSINKIFSIDWLEQLTIDLEKFLINFFQNQILLEKEEKNHLASSVNNSKTISEMKTLYLMNSISNIANDHIGEMSNNKNNNEIDYSTFKSEKIGDCIGYQQNIIKDNNICTKSSETHISKMKIDSTLTSEPNQIASIITPNIFDTTKQCICNNELNVIKTSLINLHKHYTKLKLRFHKLHEDYQKMNDVAEVLAISLENSLQGKPINLDMILQSRLKIFPDKFNTIIQTDAENSSIDLKENLLTDICIADEEKNIKNNDVVSPKLLDYKKIKFHLKYGNTKTKVLLLQALRQKLTLYQGENQDDIIYEYTENDLLELQESIKGEIDDNNLFHLLQPVNLNTSINFIQQTTSRFLNTLASFSCGRIYLSSSSSVLNIIIMYLDSCSNNMCDDVTLDMLLATLQKLSLRKKQRNYMIEINLVEWLIYHLSTKYLKMRIYRLEYACALLMNLSLHSAARFRASIIASLFISTMINLLSTNFLLILPYINGALQNFLLNNEINEEAKKLALIKILEYHYANTEEELRIQFLHTIKIHERECNESLSDDDELSDEDEDLFNILENELEEDDPVQVQTEELEGENLLATHYSVFPFLPQSKKASSKTLVSLSTKENNNSSSVEDKKAELNISKANSALKKTRFSKSKTEITEKKTSAEVFNATKKILDVDKSEMKTQVKEEDAFLSKPKIMRTPPPAQTREDFK